jgi:thiol-disulfide isomerase/thioredoxin
MRKALAAVSLLVASALFLSGSQIPRTAPELQIQVPGGKPISLSQYKGKPVVLAFILTTCPHCQHTTGLLVKLQNEFAAKGLQVLECAVNTNADSLIPDFVKTYKTNFPVGYNFDVDYILGPFFQHQPDRGPTMPMLVFIDPKGLIRAEYEGADDFVSNPNQEQNIRGEIQKLLVRPAAAR